MEKHMKENSKKEKHMKKVTSGERIDAVCCHGWFLK